MAQDRRSQGLNIWMNGEHVAHWRPGFNAPPKLRYEDSWLASDRARPLSLSLPLPLSSGHQRAHHTGEKVENYFENLLPDNPAIRARLKARFRVRNTTAFSLLSEIGRDCVGAIQLLPIDQQPADPADIQAQPLSEEDVERILLDTVSAPAPGTRDESDEFRISIAGAQEKTALLWHQGRWCKPTLSTPTTHILKLPLGIIGGNQRDMRDSVENEWLCAQIMGAFGIEMPYCEIATFGQQKVLVVERFDRRWDEGELLRLPQEDCCQALGRPPHKKYEVDGGPGMAAIAGLLATSEEGMDAVGVFLRAQVLFYLLAATDGHAKNFSIRLLPGGAYQLTPLYDVLSIWPIVGNGPRHVQYQNIKLAMGFKATKGTKRELDKIMPRHMAASAKACGYPALTEDITAIMDLLLERMDGVGRDLPPGFPVRIYDSVRKGMSKMRDRFRHTASLP